MVASDLDLVLRAKGRKGGSWMYFYDYQSYLTHVLTNPYMDIFDNKKQQVLQTYIFFKDRIFQKVTVLDSVSSD